MELTKNQKYYRKNKEKLRLKYQEHYHKHKERRSTTSAVWRKNNKERIATNGLAKRREAQAWFKEYKSTLVCSHCPENHPSCLTFHHLADKDYEVSRMVMSGRSIKSILKEISKCIVLCANCHAKEHYESK